MKATNYRFDVGGFHCTVINDGALTYTTPAQVHFANAPLDQLGPALLRHNIQLDQWREWISPLSCLLIQTGKHQVLVDTGLGKVEFGPNAGFLIQNLQAAGVEPSDIDVVILTHAHGDHIGWNTTPDGSAAFPRARYIIRKEEWDFWTSEETLAQPQYEWMTPFVHRHLIPLSNRFELPEQDAEIVPGIHLLFAPGHTPGHTAVAVSSRDEELLCVGDVISHPLHAEQPDWHFAPDCQPDQAIRTRKQLFERAAAAQSRVFAFHLDFPGLGYVRQQQGAWIWQPIAS